MFLLFSGYLCLEMMDHLLAIRSPAEGEWVLVDLTDVAAIGVDALLCLLLAVVVWQAGETTTWMRWLVLLAFRSFVVWKMYFAHLDHQRIPLIYKRAFEASNGARTIGVLAQTACLVGLFVLAVREERRANAQ